MDVLTVYERGDRFLTTDAEGRVREWRVKADGLVVIVASGFSEPWQAVVEDGPRAEQQGHDRQAEQ